LIGAIAVLNPFEANQGEKPKQPLLLYGAIPLLIALMFAVPIYAHSVISIRLIALNALILIATGFSMIVALGAFVDVVRRRPPNINRVMLLSVATFGNMALFVAAAKLSDTGMV